MSDDRDIEYLTQAYELAAEYSSDPSTQLAALIVKDGELISWGVNNFPRGVQETPSRWIRPLKYEFVEHAERNAVYAAARDGVATEGGVMYCPWAACADCARAIIQSGIIEVVTHAFPFSIWKTRDGMKNWNESMKITEQMFIEAGIKFRIIDEPLLRPVTLTFNGEPHNIPSKAL